MIPVEVGDAVAGSGGPLWGMGGRSEARARETARPPASGPNHRGTDLHGDR